MMLLKISQSFFVKAIYALDDESVETVGEAVSQQLLKKGCDSFENLTIDNLLERV